MAVLVHATDSDSTTSASTTQNFTIDSGASVANKVLTLYVNAENGASSQNCTGVDYNGVAMVALWTQLVRSTATNINQWAFRLASPANGSNTASATFTQSGGDALALSCTLSGAHQTEFDGRQTGKSSTTTGSSTNFNRFLYPLFDDSLGLCIHGCEKSEGAPISGLDSDTNTEISAASATGSAGLAGFIGSSVGMGGAGSFIQLGASQNIATGLSRITYAKEFRIAPAVAGGSRRIFIT